MTVIRQLNFDMRKKYCCISWTKIEINIRYEEIIKCTNKRYIKKNYIDFCFECCVIYIVKSSVSPSGSTFNIFACTTHD